MPIRVDQFKGMIPRLHPSQLPDGAGSVVHNYVASSGALIPFSASGPFQSSHDDDGLLLSGISDQEVVAIAKPPAPTLKSRDWQCQPGAGAWLRITLVSFVSLLDENGGRQTFVHHAIPLQWRGEHTERGLNLFAWTTSVSPVRFYYGGPYYFRGPRFMFSFFPRPGEYGGPASREDLPGYVLPGSPVFSTNAIPLINADKNVYGEFQVVDYSGPVWDEDFMITDYPVYTYFFGDFGCSFRINLNYSEPRRKHWYFVTSGVDEDDREGPPSEISELMIQRPGQVLTVGTPHTTAKVRLYRSETVGEDSFRLVREGRFEAHRDGPTPAQDDEIPPFGNWTASGAPSKEEFLRGSLLHPAGFGVAFYGSTVWCSDVFRLHAWPEENTTEFKDPVLALAMAGDTVVVFTSSKVYGLSGNDPGRMAKYQVSASTPLLDVRGLVQVGNVVYWPTHDGLAACDGGRVEIATKDFFTRKDWRRLNPSTMESRAEHDCIYLGASFSPAAAPSSSDVYKHVAAYMLPSMLGSSGSGGSTLNLRIDLKDPVGPVTTFSDFSGGDGMWRSRLYEFAQGTTFDLLRISSTGGVRVVAIIDGVAQPEVVLEGNDWHVVNYPHGRTWVWVLKGEGTITCFEALDRVVVPGQDVNVFTPETAASFRNIRIEYPEPETICALLVSCQSGVGVPVRLYAGGETSPYYEAEVRSGGVLRVPLEDRVRSTSFRVEADTSIRIDQLVVAREVEAPGGEVIQEGRGGLICPWLLKSYVWPAGVQMRSVRVAAAGPVWMRLYFDDSTEPDAVVSIGSAWEHRVVSGAFTKLRYCFVDQSGERADDLVLGVTVATGTAVEAPSDGVHLMGSPAYRSQVYRFSEKGRYSAAQVTADSYPIWLDIYRFSDRAKAEFTVTVRDDKTFALPWEVEEDATLWEFDLRSTKTGLETRVHGFHLYGKTGVPVPDGVIRLGYSGGPAPWLIGRYEFERVGRLCSRRVETVDGLPVWMQLYVDGAAWGEPQECLSGVEQYLAAWPGVVDARTVEMRFFETAGGKTPADHRVLGVNLYVLRPEPVQDVAVFGDYPFLSRELTFPHAGRFTAAQVVLRPGSSSTGQVYLRLCCGAEWARVLVETDRVFALPSMATGSQWSVSVEGGEQVKQVVLYAEQTVPARGGIEAHAGPGAPDWLRSRYEWGEPTCLSGVRVESEQYPVTLEATTDQGVQVVTVESEGWTPTGWTAEINRAVFRFLDGGDVFVRCVRLLPQEDLVVGADGVVSLSGLPFYWGIRLRFAQSGAWAGVSVDAEDAAHVSLRLASGGTYTAVADVAANDPMLRRVKGAGESLTSALTDPTYGSLWILDVDCPGKVHSVLLLAWTPEDVGDVVGVSNGPGIPGWYRTRYRFQGVKVPRSVFVNGASDLSLYCGSAKETFSASEEERRISTRRECDELVFDFEDLVTADGAVVTCEEHVAVGAHGVVIRQADGVTAWRNKVLRLNEPGAFSVARVRHASAVRLRRYGTSTWTSASLDSDYTVVLPLMEAAQEWELDIEHDGPVLEVDLFTRVESGLDGGVAVWRRDQDPVCWLDKRVLAERSVSFSCGRVVATGPVLVVVRNRERTEILYQVVPSGGGAFRFPRLSPRRSWVFDLIAGSGVEIEEFAVSTSMGRL